MTCESCGATEGVKERRPGVVMCEDVSRCYERQHAARKNERATHRGGHAAPFFDSPPGTCRWCGEPIVHGRVKQRRWHDGRLDEPHCTLHYAITQGSAGARAACKLRDREICGWCGVDVADLERRWERARRIADEVAFDVARGPFDRDRHRRATARYEAWLAENPRPGWAADHVVPLIDGGPNTLANLQTLCDPCHSWKTAREARERAARRRGEASPREAARAEQLALGL